MSMFMENNKSHSSVNSCTHLCLCSSSLFMLRPDAVTPPLLQGAPSSPGPSAPRSRLINHGAWVMTPRCSPNVFWQEAAPWAPSSRSHTYGRCEWVTGPLLCTTEAISGAYTDTGTRTHTRRRLEMEKEEGVKCCLAGSSSSFSSSSLSLSPYISKWDVKNNTKRAK